MPRKTLVPKYLCHKKSGQAYTYHSSIETPDHRLYLGKYGSQESIEKHQEIVNRLAAGQPARPPQRISRTPTIARLVLAYDDFARVYYAREDGQLATEYEGMRSALGMLVTYQRTVLGANYGPRLLKELRDALIARGYARSYVNKQVNRVRRFFGWASSEELIPPSVYHGLKSVKSLRRGEMGVREAPEVRPAPLALVEKLLPFVPPVIGDMLQTQYFCAMRPGEVCLMRPCDVDRSGDIWIYKPERHKNGWRGKTLFKAIPRAAQVIIAPRLLREPRAYLFPPADSWRWSLDNRKTTAKPRKTKVYGSELERLARQKEERRLMPKQKAAGPHYTTDSYHGAVEYAFNRATRAGVQVERFTPNQLRHAIVTFISRELGQQKAQRYAGHDSLDATSIYTEKDVREMIDVARQLDAIWAAAS